MLRGLQPSAPNFMKARFHELCLGNTYAATLYVIAAALRKLGVLSRCDKVYRGMSGGSLPASFKEPDGVNFTGGVEFGL